MDGSSRSNEFVVVFEFLLMILLTVNAQLFLGGDIIAHIVVVIVVVGSASNVLKGFRSAGNSFSTGLKIENE